MDSYALSTTLALVLLVTAADVQAAGNNGDYYNTTCPQAPIIVKDTMHKIMQSHGNIAGGILRLQFHDCIMASGCDGSILLSSPNGSAERDALKSSLRGFDKIDEIKAAVEKKCPGIVSCADILALAARDAVVEAGGKGWFVTLGRKDGHRSSRSEPPLVLPGAFMTYYELTETFMAKGFTAKEMVTLSGAHSLGRAVCGLPPVQIRYYQFNGSLGSTDPSIDPKFARSVKKMCPRDPSSRVAVPLDPSMDTFDNKYYKAILANRGVLKSDAALRTDPDARKLVTLYAKSDSTFQNDFAAAMEKLINQRWAPDGEVRRLCNSTNH